MSGSGRDSSGKGPAAPAAGDDPWAKWRKPAEAAAKPAEKPADKPPRRGPEREALSPGKKTGPAAAPAKAGAGAGPAKALAIAAVDAKKAPKSKTARPAADPSLRPAAEARPLRSPVAKVPEVANEVPPAKPSGTLGVSRSAAAQPRPLHKKPARAGAVAKRPTLADKARAAEQPVARPAAAASQAAESRRGTPPEGVRLSKVMSERGLCSRREADLWIERGWVFVDGEQISELGSRIDPAAEITVSKEAKKDQAKAVTILLHKPVGYVSGQPEPGMQPAVTLVTAEAQVVQSGDAEFKPWMLRGLAPAGRLDVDSTGLLVLTSDGRVAKRLIGEDSDAEKEYLVRVAGQMIKGGLDLLRHGLELDGKALKPAWVKQLNEDQLHFILKEGKKRQIRRMCELVGLRVIGLKRVRIGRIRLGDLPMGQWRFLRADEAF